MERIARGRWARAEEIRAAILELCTGGYRTVQDLAAALSRDPKTIQQNYISKLVNEGELEARYPDTPNHPSQAYKARTKPSG